jgi:hypothetical protein
MHGSEAYFFVFYFLLSAVFFAIYGSAQGSSACAAVWQCSQWLNRLQNRDRRFMLSFTTVGVGLCKFAQPSVSVYANLLNRHRKSVKTDGFLYKRDKTVGFWCRFQLSSVGVGFGVGVKSRLSVLVRIENPKSGPGSGCEPRPVLPLCEYRSARGSAHSHVRQCSLSSLWQCAGQ